MDMDEWLYAFGAMWQEQTVQDNADGFTQVTGDLGVL
jgi:hypothetical protein